jgi:hypothetical protein
MFIKFLDEFVSCPSILSIISGKADTNCIGGVDLPAFIPLSY